LGQLSLADRGLEQIAKSSALADEVGRAWFVMKIGLRADFDIAENFWLHRKWLRLNISGVVGPVRQDAISDAWIWPIGEAEVATADALPYFCLGAHGERGTCLQEEEDDASGKND